MPAAAGKHSVAAAGWHGALTWRLKGAGVHGAGHLAHERGQALCIALGQLLLRHLRSGAGWAATGLRSRSATLGVRNGSAVPAKAGPRRACLPPARLLVPKGARGRQAPGQQAEARVAQGAEVAALGQLHRIDQLICICVCCGRCHCRQARGEARWGRSDEGRRQLTSGVGACSGHRAQALARRQHATGAAAGPPRRAHSEGRPRCWPAEQRHSGGAPATPPPPAAPPSAWEGGRQGASGRVDRGR